MRTGQATNAKDPMHGKRPFPWPQATASAHCSSKTRAAVSPHHLEQIKQQSQRQIHSKDGGMGMRLESLLKAGAA